MPRLTGRQIERRQDAVARVREAQRRRKAAEDELGWAIAEAKLEGVQWRDIADALGMDWRSARLIARKAGRKV